MLYERITADSLPANIIVSKYAITSNATKSYIAYSGLGIDLTEIALS